MYAMKSLLIYGDYWHAVGPYEKAFERTGKLPGESTVLRFPETFDPDQLRDLDFLVLCKESLTPASHAEPGERSWMTLSQEQAIVNWVEQGGTLFVWHAGAAGYEKDGLQQLFGGRFEGHPPVQPYRVRVNRPDHLLAAGVEAFEVSDELYYFTTQDSSGFPVFLTADSGEHGIQPVAWSHEHGKGLVMVFLLGHLPASLDHPASRQVLKNIRDLAVSRAG